MRAATGRLPTCYHGAARTGGEGERMLAKVLTGAVVGLDGALVEVEVDIAPGGLPNFLVVGLPDAAVQEARERVRAAIRNSGLASRCAGSRSNLAPADLQARRAPAMTCPSRSASCIASGQVEAEADGVLYLGELSAWTVRCGTPTASSRMVALARERGLAHRVRAGHRRAPRRRCSAASGDPGADAGRAGRRTCAARRRSRPRRHATDLAASDDERRAATWPT